MQIETIKTIIKNIDYGILISLIGAICGFVITLIVEDKTLQFLGLLLGVISGAYCIMTASRYNGCF